MNPTLTKRIEDIINDKLKGAAQVAQQVLEFLKNHAQVSQHLSDPEFMQEIEFICDEFKKIDAELAPVHNSIETFNRKLRNLSENGKSQSQKALEIATTLLEDLLSSYQKIACYFSRLIHQDITVMTLSQSSTIRHIIQHNKNKIKRVYIMESRPLREGRQQAELITSMGIPAFLIADAACGHFARETDIVVVGADRILRDGSIINKVGSYPLALVARENVIPFYVACESIKWDPRCEHEKFTPVQKDEVEMFKDKPENLKIKNIYFERIPPELITRIITEKASFG